MVGMAQKLEEQMAPECPLSCGSKDKCLYRAMSGRDACTVHLMTHFLEEAKKEVRENEKT